MSKLQKDIESVFQNNRSSMNTSKAKAMYSFCKGDRFPNLHSESKYDSSYLDLLFMISSRCSVNELPPSAMATK